MSLHLNLDSLFSDFHDLYEIEMNIFVEVLTVKKLWPAHLSKKKNCAPPLRSTP